MLKFNPAIFKAYDIRGIYNQDFKDDFAYYLGLSFASLLKKEIKKEKLKIVIAHDMRLSSPAIFKQLLKGLLQSGADVYNIGLNSTPSLYFAVSHLKADGGIIVSASHNPKEYNGFKLVKNKGQAISGEGGLYWLRDNLVYEKNNNKLGQEIFVTNILEKQIEHDIKYFNKDLIKNLNVGVDPANAMGSLYLEKLSSIMPINVKGINMGLDGTFPAHQADPLKEENLEQLSNYIKAQALDLGIATDGDGDRVFFLDEKGKIIKPAIIRGVLAKLFLKDKPGAKMAYDVRPGKITKDLIEKHGGIPVITKVGHALIKEQMIKEDIFFAGESSGHFYLNLDIGCYEMPIIVIAKILTELSQSGKRASQYFSTYDKYYHSGEINTQVDDKEGIIKKIADSFRNEKQKFLDGLSVEAGDFWFNIRGSNTENKLRLNIEAKSQEIMEEKRDEILRLMNS
jgi:phosphomannomutase